MTKMLLSLSMIFLSLFMLFLKHPLSMGLMILIQTFMVCLISGMISYTYWFSYILFLTFLGGLLVLFIYVASIASNEMFIFTFKNKILMFFMFVITPFLSTFFMNNLNWMNLFINSHEMNNFFNFMLFFNNENCINLSKLYNSQTYFLMIMMIIYLLITLIAVVKITNIFYGPLRSY
uniref:NADH-ubiquinone oxidoreductase chain 6 n=1 Tax=Celaenorrhinus maculosa TaxID=1415246 RepID=U5U4U9_9NEOP|nr:NADH dehydrogenase subunit 6 [Celaenorrhinus maculosa]AGZ17862.1 NADH dehydrogenase subunit 6 [Celaenorrhinus maculosa]